MALHDGGCRETRILHGGAERMPLNNDAKKSWEGWLVDGAGGREQEYQQALIQALTARNIPKVEVRPVTVNMWWRKDSLGIDVKSTLDGDQLSTIHVQEYGTSLWVGRAAEATGLT